MIDVTDHEIIHLIDMKWKIMKSKKANIKKNVEKIKFFAQMS